MSKQLLQITKNLFYKKSTGVLELYVVVNSS